MQDVNAASALQNIRVDCANDAYPRTVLKIEECVFGLYFPLMRFRLQQTLRKKSKACFNFSKLVLVFPHCWYRLMRLLFIIHLSRFLLYYSSLVIIPVWMAYGNSPPALITGPASPRGLSWYSLPVVYEAKPYAQTTEAKGGGRGRVMITLRKGFLPLCSFFHVHHFTSNWMR